MDLGRITTIVFDLDGTLCYYAISTEEAIAESLRRVGHPEGILGSIVEVAARYDGLWREEEANRDGDGSVRVRAWKKLLREHEIDGPNLAEELSKEYTSLRVPSISLFKGARELLEDLRRRYKLGLLTNGPSDMQWQKIGILGMMQLFDAVVVSGDMGVYKPDPGVFLAILKKLSSRPDETLYIGDSYPMDVVGAKAAGIFAAWVKRDGNERPAEEAPDLLLKDVVELREVLLEQV